MSYGVTYKQLERRLGELIDLQDLAALRDVLNLLGDLAANPSLLTDLVSYIKSRDKAFIYPDDSLTDSAGNTITVPIWVVDGQGSIDTFRDTTVTATLVTPGSASFVGSSVATITSGVGSVQVTDAVAETVTLGLSDTAGLSLNVSDQIDLIFT